MIGPHFRAFLWLRWRLLVNQMKKAGTANTVLMIILAVLGVLFAAGSFVGLFAVGLFAMRAAPPSVELYVWDGIVVVFLFVWITGLVVELQRSESLSLEKFLHLPVALRSAFLINYLSSLICPSMILFVPGMVGLCLGSALGRGPIMLALLPLLTAFLLAVTGLTYQFQGWLASLMTNPRRRRTVIVVATATLILVAQLPNLINIMRPWDRKSSSADRAMQNEEINELGKQLAAGKIAGAEYQQRTAEVRKRFQDRANEERAQSAQKIEDSARIINVALPPGWLPLGAMGLAEGNPLAALLGTVGLGLIGSASLWRAYRTTLRMYTGQFTAAKPRAPLAASRAPAKPQAAGGEQQTVGQSLLERRLPWMSEQAAAIALASFRGLARAPEAKMMLLTPVILLVIFGGMFLTKSIDPPVGVRPLMAVGAVAMVLFSIGQLVGNQFAFDRSGFRVFVLCAAPRGDILLGKNLSFAPLALGLSLLGAGVLQMVYPMRFDHFLALAPQAVSMFLLFCLMANLLSIFAPMPIAAGSMKPANPRLVPVLLHILFTFTVPVFLSPVLLPLGIEYLVEISGGPSGWPIHLGLSLVLCAAIVAVYRLGLRWQGSLLQEREQRILEVVTSKSE